MTKLEEEISAAIIDEYEGSEPHDRHAYYNKLGFIAAEVAKKYIDKAYDDGVGRKVIFYKQQWMKDNGITE